MSWGHPRAASPGRSLNPSLEAVRSHEQTLTPKGLLPWQKFFLGYVLGIWALKYPWAGLCGLILVLLFIPFRDIPRNLVLLGIFLTALLMAWFRLPETPEHIPEPIADQEKVLLQGKVDSVSYLPGDRQRIILKNLVIEPDKDPENLPGKLSWTWEEFTRELAPGQNIQAHVRVRPVRGMANFGVWNSEFHWRTQNVFWRSYTEGEHFWRDVQGTEPRGFAWRNFLKEQALGGLELPGVSGERQDRVQGMGLALFFGDRSRLDPELLESVRLASLAHTLALSGLHLGIMAGMGFLLAKGLGYLYPGIYLFLPFMKLGIVLAVPICLLYLWMGQYQPTLIRAGIMLACWGWYLFANQRRVLLDGLFAAAALISLYNPWAVFDLRLQLSVLAVAGIALVWPYVDRLHRYLNNYRVPNTAKYFLGLMAVTVIANLALLPIQAWSFNYLSPHWYLNLVWLPVLGFLVLPAGFAGLFMSLVPGAAFLGDILMSLSGYGLNYFIALLEFLRNQDVLHPIITYRPSWAHILGYFTLLVLVLHIKEIPWKKERILLGLGILACLVLLPWAGQKVDRGVEMRVLDVGQGQGVILELPGKQRVLVDGGGTWDPDFDLGRWVVVPSLTWKSWPGPLDKVILSHAHVDHYGGLIYPLKYLGADKYLHNGIWPGDRDRRRLEKALQRRDVAVQELAKGDTLDLDRGLTLEVLHPEDPSQYELLNDSSLVLRLVWEGRELALIPGDIEAEGLEVLLETEQDLSSQAMVVPHHGGRSSADSELYSRVDPEVAVVSRGYMNRFDLPHQEVIDIILEQDIELYDTAVHGETVISWRTPESEPRIRWARDRTGPKGIPYWY